MLFRCDDRLVENRSSRKVQCRYAFLECKDGNGIQNSRFSTSIEVRNLAAMIFVLAAPSVCSRTRMSVVSLLRFRQPSGTRALGAGRPTKGRHNSLPVDSILSCSHLGTHIARLGYQSLGDVFRTIARAHIRIAREVMLQRGCSGPGRDLGILLFFSAMFLASDPRDLVINTKIV